MFFRNNYAFEETDTPTEHGLPNPTLVFPSFSLITIWNSSHLYVRFYEQTRTIYLL